MNNRKELVDLLPCPFCGGAARLVNRYGGSMVECQNDQCIVGDPAPFNDFSHRIDAITTWNTRAALTTAETHIRETVEAERWQPIETAEAVAPKDSDNGKRVLLCHAPTGRMMVGPVCDFTGDDGVVRRGSGAGFGIFMATHWMPLPKTPTPPEAA